jgi:hypothetical protein
VHNGRTPRSEPAKKLKDLFVFSRPGDAQEWTNDAQLKPVKQNYLEDAEPHSGAPASLACAAKPLRSPTL